MLAQMLTMTHVSIELKAPLIVSVSSSRRMFGAKSLLVNEMKCQWLLHWNKIGLGLN